MTIDISDEEQRIMETVEIISRDRGFAVNKDANGGILVRCQYFDCIVHEDPDTLSIADYPIDTLITISNAINRFTKRRCWYFTLFNHVCLLNEPVEADDDTDQYMLMVNKCPTCILKDMFATESTARMAKTDMVGTEYSCKLETLDVEKYGIMLDAFLVNMKSIEQTYYIDQIKRAKQTLIYDLFNIKFDPAE